MNMRDTALIESDDFPFEFLSQLAERESWRKEIHRPIYHAHKWWAKRLGSVFRGILLGCALPADGSLADEFYREQAFQGRTVFDPFMGSGTTIGEAHKMGFTALGRDINPVAVEAVRTALGPMERGKILRAFDELSADVGERIRALYRSTDSHGRPCDVLYYFWVMQAVCPGCARQTDLFPSYVIARNAYPDRKPEVQVLCPACGDIFPAANASDRSACRACGHTFDPATALARGAKASCQHCEHGFTIVDAMARAGSRPSFRLYGKLVLTGAGAKQYVRATPADLAAFERCSALLRDQVKSGVVPLPTLALEDGHNTRQAMSYGFRHWRDFFNDRQLLALGRLKGAISRIQDEPTRRALLTLFSGALEFNNLFASYKGEGTGAVRHMFAHHILKPERMPIEANVWGTSKSSGSFSGLLRSRLLRVLDYREAPVELNGTSGAARLCSPPISGRIEDRWPEKGRFVARGIYLSCGDSTSTRLPDRSVDLVVTDPPFFDNVHYSELADFFFAWQDRQGDEGGVSMKPATTRHASEVQDADASQFAAKLRGVFQECHRVLKDDGLLAFTYHHSRDEGWEAVADAILGAGFVVVNSQPVKAEMSVATPKSQAKEPIQLDIILVCRKREGAGPDRRAAPSAALAAARAKLERLRAAHFSLSRNDRKIVLHGQLLTTLTCASEVPGLVEQINAEMQRPMNTTAKPRESKQLPLFDTF